VSGHGHLDGQGDGWSGFTAVEAIDFAAAELEPRDPRPGDPVLIHGKITSIHEGTATVAVYRSDPVGQSIAVQCGALELDETHGDGGTPAEPGQ
jgi:hypothetical protein